MEVKTDQLPRLPIYPAIPNSGDRGKWNAWARAYGETCARAAREDAVMACASVAFDGCHEWRREAVAECIAAINLGTTQKPCEHTSTRPHWDHIKCDVCGAIRTGAADVWGVAAFQWFVSLEAARFYKEHGRLASREIECAAPTHAIVLQERARILKALEENRDADLSRSDIIKLVEGALGLA